MQTTSQRFEDLAKGHVRPLSYALRISFDKALDDATKYFTLDESVLDGPDILAPSDANPIQLWDKYLYRDYTDRVISLEVTREEQEPYSVVQAYADVSVNNYDSYFTPSGGSPIDDNILPRRPMRVLLGFGGETVPQIVGLSETMPEIDKKERIASFHVIDFMTYLLSQDISETIILENVKTHEVLDYLLQFMGLLDTQYSLDTSLNTIKFFYVEKGTKFGETISKLMEAEMGRFYLDESGVVRFRNRYNYDWTPVYTFDHSNTIDYSLNDEVGVINSVKVISEVREVQLLQSVWTGSHPDVVPAGATVEVWAQFSDPVTSLVTPIYSDEETNTSYFTSNLDPEGNFAYSQLGLASIEVFSTFAKLVFENTGVSDGYITAIDLYGTPAKVVDRIKVEEIDQPSIDKFEEQLYEISNEYIQDRSSAQSRALTLLNDYKDYGGGVDLEVKGNPAIQLNDAINLDLDGHQGLHIVTKTTNVYSEGKFTQRIRARKKIIVNFFQLDVSLLDGPDVLSP